MRNKQQRQQKLNITKTMKSLELFHIIFTNGIKNF